MKSKIIYTVALLVMILARYSSAEDAKDWVSKEGNERVVIKYYNPGKSSQRELEVAYFINGKEVAIEYFESETKSKFSVDLPDGVYKEYGPVRVLMCEYTYKDNKRNGPYRIYHGNGKTVNEGSYKDGKMDGLLKGYYESGNLMFEMYDKDGSQDYSKAYRDYYESGKIKQICEPEDSSGVSAAKEYYEDGSLKAEMKIRKGIISNSDIKTYEQKSKK